MRSAVTVRRVEAPDDDTAALLADAAQYARLDNAATSHATGSDDLSTMTLDEALGLLRDRHDRENRLFLAESEGRVVGAATTMRHREGAQQVEAEIMVDPREPFDEIAARLLDAALEEAVAHRIDVLQTWSLHRAGPIARPLVATTGVGAVDADEPMAALLARRGFVLQQVERLSRFDLDAPAEPLRAMLADARAVAGADYEVELFRDACPPGLVQSYAAVMARMSTDAPAGGRIVEAEAASAERVRRREAGLAAQGLTSSVALAVHVPTGTVVGYNELVIGEDRTEATKQRGTLVLPEHRGHRLGTVLKCAGLLRARELWPRSPCVMTFNAEENTPMLAVNVAVGFTPAAVAGAWQRTGLLGEVSGASGSAGRSDSSGS